MDNQNSKELIAAGLSLTSAIIGVTSKNVILIIVSILIAISYFIFLNKPTQYTHYPSNPSDYSRNLKNPYYPSNATRKEEPYNFKVDPISNQPVDITQTPFTDKKGLQFIPAETQEQVTNPLYYKDARVWTADNNDNDVNHLLMVSSHNSEYPRDYKKYIGAGVLLGQSQNENGEISTSKDKYTRSRIPMVQKVPPQLNRGYF